MTTAAALRGGFLSFFGARDHTLVPSDSLIPSGDPTLLLTSAGMVQFKQQLLGTASPALQRAASCQKCLRTSDIDQVGHTNRHLTFFEMLGNFSFGDYFKSEAIAWAWEFLTRELRVPPERLWISIFQEDTETATLWQRWIKPERIIRLGADTNFWTMGPTGPCGPCSEILYDTGAAAGCGRPACGPGCDCDRYLEIWNLVFTQFNRDAGGTLHPLPRKNIDTGMGLERLAAVVQGKGSPFETEVFQPLMQWFAHQLKPLPPALTPPMGTRNQERVISPSMGEGAGDSQSSAALRVLADHTRAITFLIGDGVLPSNEGRGYILRRLLRRALRQGTRWGMHEPFLYRATEVVISQMQESYPELHQRRSAIASITKTEEEKFLETLETGSRLLNDLITQLKARRAATIPGDQAFRLYDTYGFPLELTEEIARDAGMQVDHAGFEQATTNAVETARAAWVGSGTQDLARYTALAQSLGMSSFRGYEKAVLSTTLKACFQDGQPVATLPQGATGEVLLAETPFYAEGGGQVGDMGWLLSAPPTLPPLLTTESPEMQEFFQHPLPWCAKRGVQGMMEVLDTQAPLPGFILHRVRVTQGGLQAGTPCWAIVNTARRRAVMRHHTATHLLHAVLRRRLGTHVTQAGSLVAPDRLRFDFTHAESLGEEDLLQAEQAVNIHILNNLLVRPRQTDRAAALRLGALALFGEKYGDEVRCVLIGPHGWEHPEEQVSLELCGGTHVETTGELGFLKITNLSSIGSGLRRIEAVAGTEALQYVRGLETLIKGLAQTLHTTPQELADRMTRLLQREEALTEQLKAFQTESLQAQCAALLPRAERVGDVSVISGQLEAADGKQLGNAADQLKAQLGSGVVVLAALGTGKIMFVVSVTGDLLSRGLHAGTLAKEVAARLSGSGGGRPEFAQGGGKDLQRLTEVLQQVPRLVAQQLSKQ